MSLRPGTHHLKGRARTRPVPSRAPRTAAAALGSLSLLLVACAENPFDTDAEPAGTGLHTELATPQAPPSGSPEGAPHNTPSDAASASTAETAVQTEDADQEESSSTDDDVEAASAASELPEDLNIPSEWLSSTAEAWPESAGFGASMPVLNRQDQCAMLSEMPQIFAHRAVITDTGFGPLGADAEATDSYRYLCNFWSRGYYSGRLQLLSPASAQDAAVIAENFMDQPSSEVQENSVDAVEIDGHEFLVLTRWYPVPEHGLYQALYHDLDQGALALLEVNSLDERTWESGSPEQIAEELGKILAAE